MIRGVALAQHLIPIQLAEKAGLDRRLVHRGGEPEYQFSWLEDPAVLPIWDDDGRFRLVQWGNRRNKSRWLPCLPVTQLSTVEAGIWKPFQPRRVEIPASLILEGKVWALLRDPHPVMPSTPVLLVLPAGKADLLANGVTVR
jgi:hypothetical protein